VEDLATPSNLPEFETVPAVAAADLFTGRETLTAANIVCPVWGP
jgi:hypothetical protein